MLRKTIKRILLALYPELNAGLHLPHWGQVAAVPLAINPAAQSTAFKPLYAVDVQLFNKQGQPDLQQPILKQVPLPASFAGNQRGAFGFPQQGTLVELGFIRGLPSKPFIRSVLIENLTVPNLGPDDVLIKQSEKVYQRADGNGEWLRTTPTKITDQCQNYVEKIEQIKQSLAGQKQIIKVNNGGKIWLGNEADNILKILSDLIQTVSDISKTAAKHDHPKVAPCSQAGDFNGYASQADGLKGKVDGQTE